MIEVRLFAAAADAAGTTALHLDTDAHTTVGDVRRALGDQFGGELRRVLERCSVLVSGVRADEHEPVADGAVVDVLPPFAGG